MGVWGQQGRRGSRFSRRFLGRLIDLRYGAAEAVLAAVAVVLVVWMLWPEESGPQLEQRASWQESVEAAERRRSELEAERAASEPFDSLITRDEDATPDLVTASPDLVTASKARPAAPERRRIAAPSELADRLDRFGRRPGALAANQSIQPTPRRPAAAGEPAIDVDVALQAYTGSEAQEDVPNSPPETVHAALGEATGDPSAPGDVAGLDLDIEGLEVDALEEAPSLDVAALPKLTLEPLPEVDLSDLDSLVPPESKDAEIAAQLPDDAVITPSQDAAIEPFIVEPDPAAPSIDVRQRPRDDAPSWLKNAVASSISADRPIIAIVIDDLGLNRRGTAALNDLPAPLTLAFLPYAGRIEAQTEAALAAGHELMLHLPMEPVGSDWPGPDALTTTIDQAEFVTRLKKNLDRFDGFVGINNHMGSRLTADSTRMEVVMQELRERDVLFLDSKTSARSVASDMAGRAGVPNTSRDIFLDHVIDQDAIRRQLALAERVAQRSGSAVAIGHPHGATIEALREWLPTLESRGFALAPISAVVARRACRSGVLITAETCGRYLQARTPDEPAIVAKDG